MKITKFVHSCLLVEGGQSILFDPGIYSRQSGLLELDKLNRLDKVVLTHSHQDHCDQEFIQAIIQRFTQVIIIANDDVQAFLKMQGLKFEALNYDEDTVAFNANHPSLPWAEGTVQNTGYHLLDHLTNPGDSLEFKESKSVLALPMTAPWAALKDSIECVLNLENPPQTVIPIHDWHWNDLAREDAYQKTQDVLSKHGINFIGLIDGQPVEI